MKPNLGTADRVIRIVAGLAVLGLWFVLEGGVRWWALLGLPLLATGLIGWCAVYLPFGIDTRRSDRSSAGEPRPSP